MKLVLLPMLLGFCAAVAAQLVVLPHTETRVLTCPHNAVSYRLDVALPRAWQAQAKGDWPLLLVLDSDYAFAIARNVVEHLSDRHDLPPMLVVGIGYQGSTTQEEYRRHRSRDYTPTFHANAGYGAAYQKQSGGAPDFLRCLRTHLLPRIVKDFHAGRPRVLSGHSYGGLFTAWTLLEQPRLFDGYLMVSPSLWYDDQLPSRLAEQRKKDLREALTAKVYGGVGALEVNAQWGMPQELAHYARTLRAIAAPGLCLRTQNLDNETHNSVYPRALSNGLRFLWSRRDGSRAFSPCPAAH